MSDLLASLRRQDRGTSLVEMLVAMILLSIVLSITTSAFVVFAHNEQLNTDRTEAQASNRTGLERMLRLLRQATYPQGADESDSTTLWEATTNRVVFFTHVKANQPVARVVLEQESDGTIKMGVSQPVCTSDPTVPCEYTAPTPTQVVAKYVRNGPASLCQNQSADYAVFRYYAAAPVSGQLVDITPSVTGTALEGVRLKDVASVGVELYTDKVPGRPAPDCELLSGTVNLRNWRG
jgi:prepilin-type N-terminal cleavage/methylation domain-containing protein